MKMHSRIHVVDLHIGFSEAISEWNAPFRARACVLCVFVCAAKTYKFYKGKTQIVCTVPSLLSGAHMLLETWRASLTIICLCW